MSWKGGGDGDGDADSDGDGDGDAERAPPFLAEETRPAIPAHRRLRRQVSAAGDFDYQAIGNRASDRWVLVAMGIAGLR